MGNKSVHKLTPSIEIPLVIIGIASHENDYRISWALNDVLGYHFVKTDNHKAFNKRFGEMQEFSTYCSQEEDVSSVFKLVANRCDNGFLVEDLRNMDYFLIIQDSDNGADGDTIVRQLKSIPFISMAFVLDQVKIKGLSRIK